MNKKISNRKENDINTHIYLFKTFYHLAQKHLIPYVIRPSYFTQSKTRKSTFDKFHNWKVNI